MGKLMTVGSICDAAVIAAGTTVTYGPFMIERASAFSVHVTGFSQLTPSGITVTYTICTSSDGTFIAPAGASAIFTALQTTGAASFTPVVGPFIKIVIQNLDGADAATVTAKLVWQEDIT